MSVRGAHGCAFHLAEYLTLRDALFLNSTANAVISQEKSD